MKSQMMKLSSIIILCIAFFSCNVKKDLQKTKEETKTNVEVTTAITRTVTEKFDTTVVIMQDTITGTSWDLTTDPIIEFKDGFELVVKQDPKTKKITATAIKQPEKVHLNFSRVTAENINHHKNTSIETFSASTHNKIERTGGFNWNWLWLIIGIVVLVLLYYFLGGRSQRDHNKF